jgi:ADP-L-glycero-D-manno-heptose 6-epimerase
MIIVTGAAGFIGSCLISKLNQQGISEIIAVDDFSKIEKNPNLEGKKIIEKIERSKLDDFLKINASKITFIYHIGARTDTTEQNIDLFNQLNLDFTKMVWKHCVESNIKLVYASSAATYGFGEHGYDDDHSKIPLLKPLNPYGDSKNDFDKWALLQDKQPPFWAGLKFFNVYGPNEYHKGRMASVIFHAFNQISEKNSMKLFRSHNPKYNNGGQLRDFVYVKDLVNVCLFLKNNKVNSAIYNLGSGKARTFYDLAVNVFISLNKTKDIEFIDTPLDIRETYQYFTEANMGKLIKEGYSTPFHTLEEGVEDYVKNYLVKASYF